MKYMYKENMSLWKIDVGHTTNFGTHKCLT